MFVLFIIFVAIITIYIFVVYSTQKNNDKLQKNVQVVLYYVDWCHYCKEFMKSWEELKKKGKYIANVSFKEINCTNIKTDVTSFPTIQYEYDDTSEKHTGNRNVDMILFRINEILNK